MSGPGATSSKDLSAWAVVGDSLLRGFGLRLGLGVRSNEHFGFRPGHANEIGEEIEIGGDRHRFELGGQIRHIARDVERLPRGEAWTDIRSALAGQSENPGRLALGLPAFASGTRVRGSCDNSILF